MKELTNRLLLTAFCWTCLGTCADFLSAEEAEHPRTNELRFIVPEDGEPKAASDPRPVPVDVEVADASLHEASWLGAGTAQDKPRAAAWVVQTSRSSKVSATR